MSYSNAMTASPNTLKNKYALDLSGIAFDSVASFLLSTPTTDRVNLISYLGGWAATVIGARGGQFLHKTGATNTAPTVGAAVVVSTIGTDTQAGYYWDASGAEWRATSKNLGFYQFGAFGDGVTSDVTAMQDCINFCARVFVEAGDYLSDGKIGLKSNLKIEFAGDAKIIQKSGTLDYVIDAAGVSKIEFKGLSIEGDASASGWSAVRLSSCDNIKFDNAEITKASSNGVYLIGCSNIRINNSELSNNYYYGIDDRDGINNSYTKNTFYGNGDTGTVIGVGGRGVNLWRCQDVKVRGNRFVSNTEYGFRIYSEAADGSASTGNSLTDNYFRDNIRCDIVLYDESLVGTLVKQNKISGNNITRTTEPTLGVAVLLHGGQNNISDTHVYKEGTFGAFVAFQFYYAVKSHIKGCSATFTAYAISNQSSNDCTVSDFLGDGVAQAVNTQTGQDFILTNSKFVHGGTGTTDVAIDNTVATGENTYNNIILDGFHTGIRISSEAVILKDVKTINSTYAGLRKDGTDISLQEFGNNSWDSNNVWEMAALEKTASFYDKPKTRHTAAPTTLTYPVGAECVNSAPAAGQPKGWFCTVAGTPGTWVSVGNL